jgi:hypothetical protein
MNSHAQLVPAIDDFAVHLAKGFGAELLLDIGDATAVSSSALSSGLNRIRVPRTRIADAQGIIAHAGTTPVRCVAVCSDIGAESPQPPWLLDDLRRLTSAGAMAVFAANGTDSDAFATHLRHSGFGRAQRGLVANPRLETGLRSPMALVDHLEPGRFGQPPEGFSVLAVMTAYNEEDVIEHTIAHLLKEGVAVHVIDNWSTDTTRERVRRFVDTGMVTVEQFPPAGGSATASWTELLTRVSQVAAASDADWVIHHDSDEIRCSPWPGISIRHALYTVERNGFNAIDHTVIDFWPVDDSPIVDLEADRRFFQFGLRSGHFVQVKAWANWMGPAELAPSGGHSAAFDHRRVFPYKFLLKHYPIRTQAQGQKKVFAERVARWDQEEVERGWHQHYSEFRPEESFLRSREDLDFFDVADFNHRYLIERLTGLNLSRE